MLSNSSLFGCKDIPLEAYGFPLGEKKKKYCPFGKFSISKNTLALHL